MVTRLRRRGTAARSKTRYSFLGRLPEEFVHQIRAPRDPAGPLLRTNSIVTHNANIFIDLSGWSPK